jgi:hypothetical protein
MGGRWRVPRRKGLWQQYDWVILVALVAGLVVGLVGLGWTAALGVAALGNIGAYWLRRR